MVFSTTTFLFVFLPAVFVCYWLPDAWAIVKGWFVSKTSKESENLTNQNQSLDGESSDSIETRPHMSQKWRNYKNLVLLAFSILFYAWGEPAFVFVMILSIIANYSFGMAIDKHREHAKGLLWGAVGFNIGVFFIFKYLCFTLQNIGWLINKDFSYIKIALPIGISFYTFQSLSYVIDVFKNKVNVQKNPFYLGLYISLFPQLIAGPIVRYETVAEEIENRNENYDDFAEGSIRFIQGLAKKVIIANNVALIADAAFKVPVGELSMAFAWLGVLAHELQVFFDFSGYSDMAIGLGRMFGFHFLENFDHPYTASSMTEFWRRWHISLGTWLRDYVYFPLGGSRVKTKLHHLFNIFVVWFLTGFWHGASWNFIVWGMCYFVALMIEKALGLDRKKVWWGHITTPILIGIINIFPVVNSVGGFLDYTSVMFGIAPGSADFSKFWLYLSNYKYYLLLGILFNFDLPINLSIKNSSTAKSILSGIAILALFLVCVIFINRDGYNPFIYFNF